jgi:hypothetical protein
MLLACRKMEVQRMAYAIAQQMDFRRKTATATA